MCPPEGASIYFEDDAICEGYWADSKEGADLQCATSPFYVEGCGCGCYVDTSGDTTTTTLEAEPVDCSGVPENAMGVGTPDETCDRVVIDCLPGYLPWTIAGCGCGCYIAPSPETTTTTEEPEGVCPPPGADLLVGTEITVAGEPLCDILQRGEMGGIICANGWEPYYMSCGCGCKPPASAELFIGDTSVGNVSRVLNGDLTLSTLLLLFVAVCVVYQVYSCWASSRKSDGYFKL